MTLAVQTAAAMSALNAASCAIILPTAACDTVIIDKPPRHQHLWCLVLLLFSYFLLFLRQKNA